MRWDNLFIAGTGVALGREVSVASAIADGLYDSAEAAKTQQLAVSVAAAEQPAPDFAVAAARDALKRSGYVPADVGVLAHAVVFHAGIDCWNSAAYVADGIDMRAGSTLFAEVRGGCNGGLIAVELATAYLASHPTRPAAIVTTADSWADPAVDRWRAESGLVLGDGGAALVLSRDSGLARIAALCTTNDPSLERMHRGDEQFGPFRHSAAHQINFTRRAREFLRTASIDDVRLKRSRGLRAAVDQATDDAGIRLSDISYVHLPFIGAHQLVRDYLDWLELPLERSTFDLGRRTGHLGPGDTLAGLHHLVSSRRLSPGDWALLIGDGGGWNWTAALVQML